MTRVPRVLLIGGISHVGKSTQAAHAAVLLGWSVRSTDVVAHYATEAVSGVVDAVLGHDRRDVTSSDVLPELLRLAGAG